MIEMLIGTHGRTGGVYLIANASSQYAAITLTANNSYVLIGNANGTT